MGIGYVKGKCILKQSGMTVMPEYSETIQAVLPFLIENNPGGTCSLRVPQEVIERVSILPQY